MFPLQQQKYPKTIIHEFKPYITSSRGSTPIWLSSPLSTLSIWKRRQITVFINATFFVVTPHAAIFGAVRTGYVLWATIGASSNILDKFTSFRLVQLVLNLSNQITNEESLFHSEILKQCNDLDITQRGVNELSHGFRRQSI